MNRDRSLRGDAARRERRLALLVCAGIIVVGSVGELFYREVALSTLAVRLLWGMLLAGLGFSLMRVSPRWYAFELALASVGSVTCFSITVWQTGGFFSADFLYLAPLPLVLMVIFQDEVFASFLSTVATLVAIGWMGIAGAATTPQLADSLSAALTFGALAIFGAFSFRRVRRKELEFQLARNEATEQLALSESRRSLSERLAQLGQLAAGVAHELANPLAYMGSNLRTLASEDGLCSPTMDADDVKELLADVRTGVDRLAQITGDLKSFSSGGSDAPQDCDSADVIADALRLASLRIDKSIEVRRASTPDVPMLRVNRRKLSQVLLNLLVNAAEAMSDAHTRNPSILIAVDCDGDSVQISIQDNGPGIPASIAAHLFEPFVTSKPIGKGTGLGLTLSREYVEGFGGKLQLQQSQGAGARFSIRLPASRAEA